LRNSNTSREARTRPRWSYKGLLAAVALVCFASSANGLGSNKAISQYLRDHWGAEQGFPGGPVYAFAQTPDGYLWIGAEKGLVRFDGVSFRLFQHSDTPALPDGPVLGLAVDAEGTLWLRLGTTLLRYHNGIFEDVAMSPRTPDRMFTAMCAGANGDIIFASSRDGIVRYSKGKLEQIASGAPGLVISMAVGPDGKVWMGTQSQGVVYLENGRLAWITKGVPDQKINSLLAVTDRELWVSTDNGLARWDGNEFSQTEMSSAIIHIQASTLIRDRDSNIWVGASNGLIRVDPRGISSVQRWEKRSAKAVNSLFEDREGSLWVGTNAGLERLRDSVFTTYSVNNGLPAGSNGPIYVDSEGRTWFAPAEGGLYWMKDGRVGSVKDARLEKDVVYSIDGGKDGLWIGWQRGGLTYLHFNHERFTAKTYTEREGLAQNSVYAVHENRDGTVWAGTVSGGLSWFSNDSFKTHTTANGLASNAISTILEGSDGTMWFGTPNGLNALSDGRWRVYTSRDGLPPGNVNCLLEAPAGVLWIGTLNGLAFLRSGAIRLPGGGPQALREQILGMASDKKGSVWLATPNHILQIDRDKSLSNDFRDQTVREYGVEDGLRSTHVAKRQKSVIADSLGRIWFSTEMGLSFVDPKPVSLSSAPALVHIEGVAADGRFFAPEGSLRIPAPHRKITLDYTALSLAAPERIRFKYKLDGYDQDWSDATVTREAVYTNLPADKYRFRVIASNSEGMWNSSESILQLVIEPLFWQTWWFRLSILITTIIMALAFVRLRMIQLTKQLNIRFEERLAERNRIAQELHDTLLQGMLSASMQLNVADEHLSPDSPAKPLVGRVLELMGSVIEEGRNAVQGLRSAKGSNLNLEQALSQVRQEFPLQSQIAFRVIVEGESRPLRPLVRDDVYRICHEALSNAFRHSHASDIEVEVEYAPRLLRILIRDNGGGIDPEVLRSGRDGHWGLSGMKERTERIGGKLRVLSRADAGTEVELSVPGQLAFELLPGARSERRLSKLFSRKKRSEESRSVEQQIR